MKEIFQTAVTFDLNEKKSYITPNSTVIQLESELSLMVDSPNSIDGDPMKPGEGGDNPSLFPEQ